MKIILDYKNANVKFYKLFTNCGARILLFCFLIGFGNISLYGQNDEYPKLYDYKFNGISSFHERNLKKILELYSYTFYDKESLEIRRQKIIDYFLDLGYYQIKVDYEIIEKNIDYYSLIFNIDPGKTCKIEELEIKGMNNFKAKKIVKHMDSETWGYFSLSLLEQDKLKVINFYLDKGYYNVKIPKIEYKCYEKIYGAYASVTIYVEEGEKYPSLIKN